MPPEESEAQYNVNENPMRRADDSVSIPTPFGQFKATGANVITMILIVAILFAFGWFLSKHDDTTHSVIRELRILQYVIALPQDKREALNLSMPDELRQRQVHN